jgi:hypothetical protein
MTQSRRLGCNANAINIKAVEYGLHRKVRRGERWSKARHHLVQIYTKKDQCISIDMVEIVSKNFTVVRSSLFVLYVHVHLDATVREREQ